MVGDVTCQSIVQQAWGTERENYASIMFQYLPFEGSLPTEKVGRMTYCGLVVIDFVSAYWDFPTSQMYPRHFLNPSRCLNVPYGMEIFIKRWCANSNISQWLSPVKEYFSFPLVLSSKYEGAFMEPCQRYRREIRYEDFRARM